MTLKKHLFLTGEKQVGKSTLLRCLIEGKRLECAGFETLPLTVDGIRRGFLLHGRVEMPPFENDCLISARISRQRSVPIIDTFRENGVRMLELSLEAPAPYVLMDELGRLESGCPEFAQAVLKVLDSGKPCLGVLQKCGSELVETVARREDVTLLTVTPENRDELLRQLLREAF